MRTPPRRCLRRASTNEARTLIDAYAQLVRLHWGVGFAEWVGNCTLNNGMTSDGRLILLDFGEVTAKRELALQDVVAERWRNSYSYTLDIPKRLKRYYAATLASQLSFEALVADWPHRPNNAALPKKPCDRTAKVSYLSSVASTKRNLQRSSDVP